MSEKTLKSLKLHGLDDIYKIPSTAEDVGATPASHLNNSDNPHNVTASQVGAAIPSDVTNAKTAAINESKTYTDSQVRKAAPRNLLDNSDFRNPVNQRNGYFVPVGTMRYRDTGLTTEHTAVSATSNRIAYPVNSDYGYVYSGDTKFYVRAEDIHAGYSEMGYTIDRCVYSKASADGKNLLINAGSITIESGWIYQFIEGLDTTKKYTFAWCDDTGYIFVNNSPIRTDISSYPAVVIDNTNGKNLIWAALYEGEYTAETLPEYQPKGYSSELLECYRYFYSAYKCPLLCFTKGHTEWSTNGERFPVPMRISPTCEKLREVFVGNSNIGDACKLTLNKFGIDGVHSLNKEFGTTIGLPILIKADLTADL